MFRRWFRHCPTAFFALVLLAVAAGLVGLWKLNQRGFSGEWSERLEAELARMGLEAEFSTARLSWSRGLVARDLKIYADTSHRVVLASADRLEMDIDRNAALRGEWEVRSARFENASFKLPDSCHPHELTALTGSALFGRDQVLRIENATGLLGDLAINLNLTLSDLDIASLLGKRESEDETPVDDFIADLQKELSLWSISGGQPAVTVNVEGRANHPGSIAARFRFDAPRLTRRSYTMNGLSAEGRITSTAIDLSSLAFQDDSGSLEVSGYYDFRSKLADFKCDSSANLGRLLAKGFDSDRLERVTFTTPPRIHTRGELRLYPEKPPEIRLTGHLAIENFRFLDEDWKSLDSDFSWQSGDLYLRDLTLAHQDGQLAGRLLFQDDNVRYEARTSLPVRVFEPFMKPNGDITKIVGKAGFSDESEVMVDLRGNIRPSDLTDWSASGEAVLKNFTYNGVAINRLSSSFNLTPLQAIYLDTAAEFDLTSDWSRRKFGGPDSALVEVEQIEYEHAEKLTQITNLHGTCWPAPVIKLFNPGLAGHIEETYRATAPPKLTSSGIIDHVPPFQRGSFDTRFECEEPLLVDFLERTLELERTSGLVQSRRGRVNIKDISAYTFSGPLNGEITVLLPERKTKSPEFFGHMRWTRLRLPEIGALYGHDKIERGLVTGRFDFRGNAGKIETLQGVGNIGLEKGELFRAPIFGPLSPLIAGIQGHEKASHDVARDASANFVVNQGILYTNDFITSTDSLTVRAQGSIDLGRQTLDITAQADTKGLLGLVTLPITVTPFKNLFQFHGTGPITSPNWVNTPFDRQRPEDKLPLVPPASKGIVVPE